MIKKLWSDFRRIPHVDWRWMLIWILIYFTFLAFDLLFPNFQGTTLIKYLGIFLCLIYTYQKFRADTFLILALLFTLLSDTILVWTPWYIAGVYCFCFAQFFHITRFTKARPKSLLSFIVMIFLIFAFGILRGYAPIYVIAGVYALTIISNLYLAIRWYLRDKQNFRARCALYGFILFTCCDICVGLRYLAIEGIITPVILPFVAYLVWLFYYPSQVFISNSSNLIPEKKIAKS